MLTSIHPKLPMRNKELTKQYYVGKLGFKDIGTVDYKDYLMVSKENIEIHFFHFEGLKPEQNYGQVYIRTNDIENLYAQLLTNKVAIHPNDPLQIKPWQQKEFSLLDPDNNLITFGQQV
jgi:hypothetical protein